MLFRMSSQLKSLWALEHLVHRFKGGRVYIALGQACKCILLSILSTYKLLWFSFLTSNGNENILQINGCMPCNQSMLICHTGAPSSIVIIVAMTWFHLNLVHNHPSMSVLVLQGQNCELDENIME